MALLKHEVNTQDFIFQGIRRWPVIKLVTLIHGYLHLISLGIVLGCWKLVSLNGYQRNKAHVLIAELLKWDPMSHVAELFRRYYHAENVIFQWVPTTFPKITGDKFSL